MLSPLLCSFFFKPPPPPHIYTLSLHDALPISDTGSEPASSSSAGRKENVRQTAEAEAAGRANEFVIKRRRSEEHTSELQSLRHLVCRLLLEKKNKNTNRDTETETNVVGVNRGE